VTIDYSMVVISAFTVLALAFVNYKVVGIVGWSDV